MSQPQRQHNHTILFNLFQCLSLFNSRNFAQILSMLFGHLLVGAYTFCNILIITAIRMVRASPLLMSHYPSVSVSCFPSVTLVLDNICSGSICPGKKIKSKIIYGPIFLLNQIFWIFANILGANILWNKFFWTNISLIKFVWPKLILTYIFIWTLQIGLSLWTTLYYKLLLWSMLGYCWHIIRDHSYIM